MVAENDSSGRVPDRSIPRTNPSDIPARVPSPEAAVVVLPVPVRSGMGFEAVAPPRRPAGEFALGGDMDAGPGVEGGLVQVMHAGEPLPCCSRFLNPILRQCANQPFQSSGQDGIAP